MAERKRTTDVLVSPLGESASVADFTQLHLPEAILNGLKDAGFFRPSPIQLHAIPVGRSGVDIIAQAKSGTGKTCVFGVLALAKCLDCGSEIPGAQCLVLSPTREVAVQSYEVITALGKHIPDVRARAVIGGLPVRRDAAFLDDPKCRIVVGTPGRTLDLIDRGDLDPSGIRLIVLDEADKLFESGKFAETTKKICSTVPKVSRQVIAISATFTETVRASLGAIMKQPVKEIILGGDKPALEGVKQYYMQVEDGNSPLDGFEKKVKALLLLLEGVAFHQCLIFCNNKRWAQVLSQWLDEEGWGSALIVGGGDMSQEERLATMDSAKRFRVRVLVSTDLVARGVDIERVNMVVCLDVPSDVETYMHRVGRTGRFGTYGVCVSIVTSTEREGFLSRVEEHAKITIEKITDPKKDMPREAYDFELTTPEEKEAATSLKREREDRLRALQKKAQGKVKKTAPSASATAAPAAVPPARIDRQKLTEGQVGRLMEMARTAESEAFTKKVAREEKRAAAEQRRAARETPEPATGHSGMYAAYGFPPSGFPIFGGDTPIWNFWPGKPQQQTAAPSQAQWPMFSSVAAQWQQPSPWGFYPYACTCGCSCSQQQHSHHYQEQSNN